MAGNDDDLRAIVEKFVEKYIPPKISDEEYEEWLKSVKVRLGFFKQQNVNLSIFNVPIGIKKLARDPYTPCAVSIGPLHHQKHEWLLKDDHKWRYMLDFFCRAESDAASKKALEECAAIIREQEEAARKAYWKNITLKKHELMEIFLVDGCFLLELFIRRVEDSHHEDILIYSSMLQDLQQDLALLENQIPFHILQSLFDNIQEFMTDKFQHSLTWYVLRFFQSTLNLSEIESKYFDQNKEKPIMHVLDMLRKSIIPHEENEKSGEKISGSEKSNIPHDINIQIDKKPSETQDPESPHDMTKNKESPHAENEKSGEKIWGFEQNAMKLQDNGIQFIKGENDLLHVSFSNGVLEIPCLFINKNTYSIWRNLIAFEQCSPGSRHHILSYVVFMRSLIKSNRDVELLEKKSIIIRKDPRSGDQDVIKILEDLCAGVELKEFQFHSVCLSVNDHMLARRFWKKFIAWVRKLWRRSMVALRVTYFATTWSILSVVAAIILLVLTVLQTVYTIVPYYNRG